MALDGLAWPSHAARLDKHRIERALYQPIHPPVPRRYGCFVVEYGMKLRADYLSLCSGSGHSGQLREESLRCIAAIG